MRLFSLLGDSLQADEWLGASRQSAAGIREKDVIDPLPVQQRTSVDGKRSE
jgi:hypothetical protein